MIDIVADKQTAPDRWSALADPTRRGIVELLAAQPRTATEIHRAFPIAAPAVSRHLRVLRAAGVISEHRIAQDGRVRVYALESQPLQDLAGWLGRVSDMWQGELDAFKDYVALRAKRPEPRS